MEVKQIRSFRNGWPEMVGFVSTQEVETAWTLLDRSENSLPASLRPPQLDALFYILQGYHVLLNISTGQLLLMTIIIMYIENMCGFWP